MADDVVITQKAIIPTEVSIGTIQSSGIKYSYLFPLQKFGPATSNGGVAVCCGGSYTKQRAQLIAAPSQRFAFLFTRDATSGHLTLTTANVAAIQLLVNGPTESGTPNGLWWTMTDADAQNIKGGAFDARDCVFLVFGIAFAYEGVFRRGVTGINNQVLDGLYVYAEDMNGPGSYAERVLKQVASGVASQIVSQGSNACVLDGGNIAQSYSNNVVIKDGEFVGTQLQMGPYAPFNFPWIAGAKDDGDQMGISFLSSVNLHVANDPANPTIQDLYAFFRAYFYGIRVPRWALQTAGITCTVGPVVANDAIVEMKNRMDQMASAVAQLAAMNANR